MQITHSLVGILAFITIAMVFGCCPYGNCQAKKEAVQNRNTGKDFVSLVFISDTHIQPDCHTKINGVKAILQQALTHSPTAIFFLGDNIEYSPDGHTAIQEKKFFDLIEENVPNDNIETYMLLGNHDVSGDVVTGETTKMETAKRYGMPFPYYSFSKWGWHIIVLDTTELVRQNTKINYCNHVNRDQLNWLATELQSHSEPTIILSHAPLTSPPTIDMWNGVIENHLEVADIIAKNGNVKAVFSGHMHTNHIFTDTNGVKHIYVGAASQQKFWDKANTYGILQLFPDGHCDFTHEVLP